MITEILAKDHPLFPEWKEDSCMILKNTEGSFSIVCNEIQMTIANVDTLQEADQFLGRKTINWDDL